MTMIRPENLNASVKESAITLNHIHIGTKNIKASVDFYSNFFGFRKKFDHGSGVFLENQSGFLIAIDPVDDVPQFPQWFHIGFCLSSELEVQIIYQKVSQNNVKFAREIIRQEGEFASFFIYDPDGYKIEVSWHKE